MQKSGFFMKIIFWGEFLFKVSAWLSNHAVCKIGLTACTQHFFPSFLLVSRL
jgi:hypothetical protein